MKNCSTASSTALLSRFFSFFPTRRPCSHLICTPFFPFFLTTGTETNYIWKLHLEVDWKICHFLDMHNNENGWLGCMNETGHLTVYLLSPSVHRSQNNPHRTFLPVEMKMSRLMGSIMVVDRWKTSRFSPYRPAR